MALRTDLVEDPAAFRALREEWDDLLARSGSSTVFQTWEWLSACREAFGGGAALRVVTVRDGGGRLVGAAALQLRRTKYYGFPVREASFVGDGFSDRQDVVVAAGDAAAAAALRSGVQALEGWDVLRLEPLPEESLLFSGGGLARGVTEECSVSPFVRVQGEWGAYYKGLSKKFRKDIRNKTNKLESFGEWGVRRVTATGDGSALVREMQALEGLGHKPAAGTAFFSREGAPGFMREVLRLAGERGWVDYAVLELGGRPLGYLLGFVRGGSYVAYLTAFDAARAEASPGKILIHEVIRSYFEHPGQVEQVDLSRGDTYIKTLWCSEARKLQRLVAFRPGLYPALVRAAVFGVRPLLKRLRRGAHTTPAPQEPGGGEP